jgi:hypothetical protein
MQDNTYHITIRLCAFAPNQIGKPGTAWLGDRLVVDGPDQPYLTAMYHINLLLRASNPEVIPVWLG